jgi:hypothetical protein
MNKPSTKSIIHGFYDKLTLNKLLIRLTLKSLSPALTTSPASSVGDPAPAMNSSDTQSVSMVDEFTTTTTTLDNKRVDKNVLETNIFCLFYGLLNSLLPLYQFGTENETVKTDYETPVDGSILKNEYPQPLKSV